MNRDLDWPARAYIYGTFGYALVETINRALHHRQKMHLYKGVLDGESVWIASWDPKRDLTQVKLKYPPAFGPVAKGNNELLQEHVGEFFHGPDGTIKHLVESCPRPTMPQHTESPWGLRAVVLNHLQRHHKESETKSLPKETA